MGFLSFRVSIGFSRNLEFYNPGLEYKLDCFKPNIHLQSFYNSSINLSINIWFVIITINVWYFIPLISQNLTSLKIRICWIILFFHDTLLYFIHFYAHLCSQNITFLFPFLFSKYDSGKPGESKLEFKERIVKSVVLKFYIYSLLIVRN